MLSANIALIVAYGLVAWCVACFAANVFGVSATRRQVLVASVVYSAGCANMNVYTWGGHGLVERVVFDSDGGLGVIGFDCMFDCFWFGRF